MKIAAVIIVILSLVIGIVPQFTDCQSQGKALELKDGRMVPMKCHWTGQGELALSMPFLGLGALLGFTRRRESYISLGVLGSVLGSFVILLPTALIGVCANPDMICNSVMKPTLILSGIVLIVTSLFVLVKGIREKDLAA